MGYRALHMVELKIDRLVAKVGETYSDKIFEGQ